MTDSLSRRAFMGVTGAALASTAIPRSAGAAVPAGAPAVILRPPAQPVAISSANSLAPVTRAAELMLQGGDTLDAAVEGVKIQELDPRDDSVGYGGLPNEDGVVQLDASCMHGPTRRAGGRKPPPARRARYPARPAGPRRGPPEREAARSWPHPPTSGSSRQKRTWVVSSRVRGRSRSATRWSFTTSR